MQAQRGWKFFEDKAANREQENGKEKRKRKGKKKEAKEHLSFANNSLLFEELCGAQYQRQLKELA